MYPDDFHKYLLNCQNYMVQYPTEENTKRFFEVQMIASKKAQAASAVAAVVGQKYPELSNNGTYPITSVGQVALTKIKVTERETLIMKSKPNFALIMFTKTGCGFCDAQKGILQFFIQKFRWPVKYVDIGKSPSVIAKFGVEQTPTLLLIKKGEENYIPLSSGVISLDDLETRVYESIRYLNGDVKPEQMDMYDYERNTSADPLAPVTMETER
jgi:conjugal transfer pilus assembly protein TraF